jgi:hypothetical protein
MSATTVHQLGLPEHRCHARDHRHASGRLKSPRRGWWGVEPGARCTARPPRWRPRRRTPPSRRTHSCSSAGDRSRVGGADVQRHERRVEIGVAGCPVRGRAAAMARCRTASGVAGPGGAVERLCAATARWCPARLRRRCRCPAVQLARRRVRPRRSRSGSGWAASLGGFVGMGQTRRVAWCPGQFPGEPGLVSEPGPNAFGTHPTPG